jgi:hypothetical protein
VGLGLTFASSRLISADNQIWFSAVLPASHDRAIPYLPMVSMPC